MRQTEKPLTQSVNFKEGGLGSGRDAVMDVEVNANNERRLNTSQAGTRPRKIISN